MTDQEKKQDFTLSYESDGEMGKADQTGSNHLEKKKHNRKEKERMFFNTTQNSE